MFVVIAPDIFRTSEPATPVWVAVKGPVMGESLIITELQVGNIIPSLIVEYSDGKWTSKVLKAGTNCVSHGVGKRLAS